MYRLILSTIFFVFLAGSSVAVPFDFDLDGLSDLAVLEKGRKNWRWKILTSSSGFQELTKLSPFGPIEGLPIPGNWFDPSSSNRAFIKLDDSNSLIWRGKKNNEETYRIEFGEKANRFLAGFDQDRNGIFDPTIVKKTGEVLVFENGLFVASDSSSESSLFSFILPKRILKRGKLSFLDYDLTGDRIAVLYSKSIRNKDTKRYKLLYQSSYEIPQTVNIRGLRRANVLNMFPLAGPEGIDRLLFVIKIKRGLKIVIKKFAGRTIFSKRYSGRNLEVFLGDFLPSLGEEFAVKGPLGLIFVNPFSQETSSLENVDGKLYDYITIQRFRKRNNGNDGTSPTPTPTSPVPQPGEGIGSVCSETRSLPAGVLWKPASDVNDARGGKPVVLLQDPYKPGRSAIKIYASNGTEIASFAFKASDVPGTNGGAEHYYSGWPPGTSESASNLASEASSLTGNSSIYFQGRGSLCYGPVSPTSRTGSLR